MGEKYSSAVGRFHMAKEFVKEKWSSTKDEGGVAHSLAAQANEAKEKVIKLMNHGEGNFDHLYRYLSGIRITIYSTLPQPVNLLPMFS